jgi:rhodanese-related sulfurtransferase
MAIMWQKVPLGWPEYSSSLPPSGSAQLMPGAPSFARTSASVARPPTPRWVQPAPSSTPAARMTKDLNMANLLADGECNPAGPLRPSHPDASAILESPYQRTTMKHLEPKAAYQFLHDNPTALFIDCRSEMEFLFVGHPVGAMMIPWNDGPDWEINPHFVAHVKKAASVDRPIVLICRSGNRSVSAGHALEEAGFSQVYNVLHGFEGELDDNHRRGTKAGWRFEGLPWEQC